MDERADIVRNWENSHKETKPTVLKHDEQQTQVLSLNFPGVLLMANWPALKADRISSGISSI
jgi:hypothetical protein